MNVWPEPSSTVVSARRVVSAGTMKPLSVTEPASLQLAHFGTDAHRDAAVGKDDRSEGEADAILLILDRDRAERLRDRDREFAAGEEARGFARKRGEVRLGERRDEAVVLGEVERPEQVEAEHLADSPSVVPPPAVEGLVRPGAPLPDQSAGVGTDTCPAALADPEL